jgi:hypothetical protein
MNASTSTRWWSPMTVALALAVAAAVVLVLALLAAGSEAIPPVAPFTAEDEALPDVEGSTDGANPSDDPDASDTTGSDATDTVEAEGPEQAEPDARRRLVIHHVGDVNLDPSQLSAASVADPANAWEGVRDTFAEADLVLVNLECAATDGGAPLDKQFVFRCDLDALPAMRDAGVDVATLANNHTGDFGVPGIVDSLRNVEAAGMIGVGVGADEEEAYRPRIVELQGWRVAIVGFGGVVPTPDWTARGDAPGQASGYDPALMAAAVEAAAADADLVIATVHWGEEGSFTPRSEDRVKADAMIAAGADVVFGHHAHRLQPLERVGEVPVFWNLGNFVWPNRSEDASRTAVATVAIEPDGRTEACLRPFRIDEGGVPRPTGAAPSCE